MCFVPTAIELTHLTHFFSQGIHFFEKVDNIIYI